MSTRVATTKIERAVEAIESLTLATVVAHHAPTAALRSTAVKNIADAREECVTAFSDFLTPVLRVHEGVS